MNRRTLLKFLALAAIDPEILVWTPGQKTTIEMPRYTLEQFHQWEYFNEIKGMWLQALEQDKDFWLRIQPDIYQRIAVGDAHARKLGIIR